MIEWAIDATGIFPIWTLYRNEWIIIAQVKGRGVRAGKAVESLRVKTDQGQNLQLPIADRYLSNLNHVPELKIVVCGWGVWLSIDGIRLSQVTARPDNLPAQLPDSLAVAFVAVEEEIDAANSKDLLRQWLGQRRISALRASCIDYGMEYGPFDDSRYKIVGPKGSLVHTVPAEGMSLWVDSNVVVDLERAATGRIAPLTREWREIVGLVAGLRGQDMISGSALAELCSDRKGAWHQNRLDSLLAAIYSWWHVDVDQLMNAPAIHRSYQDRLSTSLPDETDYSPISTLNYLNYASLLKVTALWLKAQRNPGFRANERLRLLRDYTSFVASELNGVSTFALQVALDLFIGSQNVAEYARRLLKFGKNIQPKIWGAAWDLTQLASKHSDLQGELEGRDRYLVTADKGLIGLSQNIMSVGRLQIGSRTPELMALRDNLHPRLLDHRDQIRGILEGLRDDRARRLHNSEEVGLIPPLLNLLINRLEREVSALTAR